MKLNVALVGNPNSGKSTLFNLLTGLNQYIGNWPGVTVEKKTGELLNDSSITFTDLPGVYSLSPYTLEEVITRDYLLSPEVDVVVNIIDASNIERNLYLTTQILELGIPTVLALNMIDITRKRGDVIDTKKLSELLNCEVVEISATKNINIDNLVEAIKSSKEKNITPNRIFSKDAEEYIDRIFEIFQFLDNKRSRRWIGIKLFKKDSKIIDSFNIAKNELVKLNNLVENAENFFRTTRRGLLLTRGIIS